MTASLGAAGDLFEGWNSASVSGKSGFMWILILKQFQV